MKRIASVLIFLTIAVSSFGQFSDTAELNQYIIDSIKDKRPDKITAIQVQKALLGLSQFLGGTGIDISNLHATSTLNYNGTKIIYYNYLGHPLPDSVTLPHTDIYTDGGLLQRDTLTAAVVLAAGRIDTSWISDDGIWKHNLYMSGAHDSVQLLVDGGTPTPTGSTVSSGTYTSTTTGTFNVTSTGATISLHWTKIDGKVHAFGFGTLQPEGTGATTLSLTLPSSTSFTSGMPIGQATVAENAGSAFAPCMVFTVNSTTVELKFIATYASTGSYFITLDYPE